MANANVLRTFNDEIQSSIHRLTLVADAYEPNRDMRPHLIVGPIWCVALGSLKNQNRSYYNCLADAVSFFQNRHGTNAPAKQWNQRLIYWSDEQWQRHYSHHVFRIIVE